MLEKGFNVQLINRSGKMEVPPKGGEIVKADATNFSETIALVQGAAAIYQCAQPAYHRWQEEFPQLQDAILKLAIESKSKFIVAENLYMYGNTNGQPMVETTPHNPCSKKGKVRDEMTKALFEAHKNGKVRATSVRGSDFFGPWEPINGEMIFKTALKRKTINMLGNLNQPHSFTYVKDFGKALAIAGTEDRALGKVWHVPSGEAFTQKQLLDMLSKQLGYELKARATGKFMLNLIGLFNPSVKEVVEMLYEFEAPFVIDGSAMEKTFGLTATPFEQRISETLDWAKTQL
ncbi:MAG: NAD-dependent epimerase/dehydratase family protein [Saprospirales bacterium]|nr:NAD-dependent epimerase/dehydratase family protein [Saprospirales bacterium]